MADSSVAVTAGAGTQIDTRTEAANGNHRQVVVLGDPSVNAGVAPVDVVEGLTVRGSRCATSTTSNVAASASNVTLKASNAARRAIEIYNDADKALYVKFGATASTGSFTRLLQPGEWMREELYTGIIDGIWASAPTGNARVTELTA